MMETESLVNQQILMPVNTSRRTTSELCVKMKGIINVADDRLERRNYKTPVQPVPVDGRKERMILHVTHSSWPGAYTWMAFQC